MNPTALQGDHQIAHERDPGSVSEIHARELTDCRTTDNWRMRTVGGARRNHSRLVSEKAPRVRLIIGSTRRSVQPRQLRRELKVNFTPAILACSLASLICLTGCAAQKEWAATGGSRADGTVELAYEYGAFEEPQVNNEQGVELATSTCGGWGYTASQAFGGTMSKCEAFGGYGNCLRTLVTRKYQCLGAPGVSVAPQRAPVALSPAQSNPAQPQTNLSANIGASGTIQGAPPAQGASFVPGNATAAPNPNVRDQWHESDQW